jgi:hypothetical protein
MSATIPAASAQVWPQYVPKHRHLPMPMQTIVIGGTPGWQIALIALAAAILAAIAAVIADRAWARLRTATVAAIPAPALTGRSGDSDVPVVTVSPGRW